MWPTCAARRGEARAFSSAGPSAPGERTQGMRPRLRANRRQNVFTETLEEIAASLSSVCIGRLLSDIRTPRGPQSRGSDSGPGSSSVSWTTG
ncbi:Serine--pyruvate aminotransferase [Giardia duodenalis assemblage B]|uniref:Serine--pyruvate aminotransferase n=1 Tax=Giardia duodenalis assemblage B TaxID=1394984 RepID=A0A132NXG0_GIAIN|nr:Serine--pyruvate aminotransferase [Giardia intestinalis assemblage B]